MNAVTECSPAEVVQRGKEIYESQLRAQLEPGNVGKYLMVDITTGEWEMGEDHAETGFRAFRRFGHPNIYGMRIGYLAAATIGMSMRHLRVPENNGSEATAS